MFSLEIFVVNLNKRKLKNVHADATSTYDVGQFHAWILEFLKLGVEETLGTSILPPKY